MTLEHAVIMVVAIILFVLVILLAKASYDSGKKDGAAIYKAIRTTIEDSFTAWQGHLADREAMSCIRRCKDRRPPEEYIKEKLIDIANKEMWRQVHEEAGVEEEEEVEDKYKHCSGCVDFNGKCDHIIKKTTGQCPRVQRLKREDADRAVALHINSFDVGDVGGDKSVFIIRDGEKIHFVISKDDQYIRQFVDKDGPGWGIEVGNNLRGPWKKIYADISHVPAELKDKGNNIDEVA